MPGRADGEAVKRIGIAAFLFVALAIYAGIFPVSELAGGVAAPRSDDSHGVDQAVSAD